METFEFCDVGGLMQSKVQQALNQCVTCPRITAFVVNTLEASNICIYKCTRVVDECGWRLWSL